MQEKATYLREAADGRHREPNNNVMEPHVPWDIEEDAAIETRRPLQDRMNASARVITIVLGMSNERRPASEREQSCRRLRGRAIHLGRRRNRGGRARQPTTE